MAGDYLGLFLKEEGALTKVDFGGIGRNLLSQEDEN